MPVVKVTSELGIGFDKRLRHWAKLIRGGGDVDLAGKGGYALVGPFAKWGESVSVPAGTFIVLASEVGSMKHHDYEYALVEVTEEGTRQVLGVAQQAVVAGMDDDVRAKADNSVLYRYAAYAWARFAERADEQDEQRVGERAVDRLLGEIMKLSADEQDEISTRLAWRLATSGKEPVA